MTTKTFVNGKVYVCRVRCSTCIFGKKKPVSQERVDQMIAEADANQSCIPCHHYLYQGNKIEPVCRGYYERRTSVTLRLADAMEIVEEI